MDDRKRIAFAINGGDEAAFIRSFTNGDRVTQRRLRQADAVLEVLGDRLLPEVTQTFAVGDVVHVAGKGKQRFEIVMHREEQYGLCREGVQENHIRVAPRAIRPAAAIRDAVGEAEGDDA